MATMILDGVEVEIPPDVEAALPTAAPSLDPVDRTFEEDPAWQSLIVSP